MLNTLAIAAVVVGSAALVTTAAPTVIDATTATRDAARATTDAARATSAAVSAVNGIAAPIAAVQDRGIDPADPRFGDVVGGTMVRMTDAIGRAVRDAEVSGWSGDYADIYDDGEAVDACAVAAQRDAADRARVVAIDHVGRVQRVEGGWSVEGVVLARDDFRDRSPDRWGFRCEIAGGRVVAVDFEGRYAGR